VDEGNFDSVARGADGGRRPGDASADHNKVEVQDGMNVKPVVVNYLRLGMGLPFAVRTLPASKKSSAAEQSHQLFEESTPIPYHDDSSRRRRFAISQGMLSEASGIR
jgi:hypothetical protein